MGGLLDQIRAGLYTVWNRRWIALGVAWLVCLAGWLAVAAIPNKYESHARIFVRIDDVLSDQSGLGADRHRQRTPQAAVTDRHQPRAGSVRGQDVVGGVDGLVEGRERHAMMLPMNSQSSQPIKPWRSLSPPGARRRLAACRVDP